MSKPFLLGIAGASGSGKTYLASKVTEDLGDNASLLCVDFYYKPRHGLSMEEKNRINYDHPEALELDRLAEDLYVLKGGTDIHAPVYDFSQHNRDESQTNHIKANSVIVIEGILTFHSDIVENALDYKIFVDTPIELCYQRRLERDIVERGRTKESVYQQWQETVFPMHQQFCAPTKDKADVVVEGEGGYADFLNELYCHMNVSPKRC